VLDRIKALWRDYAGKTISGGGETGVDGALLIEESMVIDRVSLNGVAVWSIELT